MTHAQLFGRLALLLLSLTSCAAGVFAQSVHPIEVLIVGFAHLDQIYNKQPSSDVFSAKKQAEIRQINDQLLKFAPDMIMVEDTPAKQGQLDSLFALYRTGQLLLTSLEHGRGEKFQVGFVLAKRLNLPRLTGIDNYQATSQSLLDSGENIDYFRQDLRKLQVTSRPLMRRAQHDSLSLYDLIAVANHPVIVALSHQAIFNTPAMVINGDFSPTGTNTVDLGQVDKAYIGAHYITLFYNRNLKIYSNILNAQLKQHGQRLLVLMGQNHVGVLQELLAANPRYKIVPTGKYLKAKRKLLPR